jgi:hypothetical protein
MVHAKWRMNSELTIPPNRQISLTEWVLPTWNPLNFMTTDTQQNIDGLHTLAVKSLVLDCTTDAAFWAADAATTDNRLRPCQQSSTSATSLCSQHATHISTLAKWKNKDWTVICSFNFFTQHLIAQFSWVEHIKQHKTTTTTSRTEALGSDLLLWLLYTEPDSMIFISRISQMAQNRNQNQQNQSSFPHE